MSFFNKLKNAIKNIIKSPEINRIDLENILIEADFGVALSEKIAKELHKSKNILQDLKICIESILAPCISKIDIEEIAQKPYTIFVIGVNGSGKTTTIAKIAKLLKEQKFSVDIAACDTFRAAATEQLAIWAHKLNCNIFKAESTQDPASLAFDAIKNSKSDVLIVDTAGRMHNNTNLMNELLKIQKVLQKFHPDAPNKTIITIDATIGQNSIEQIKEFSKFCKISGAIITKMDGGAKGGTIVRIADELKLHIVGIGTGETEKDLAPFSLDQFLQDLLA